MYQKEGLLKSTDHRNEGEIAELKNWSRWKIATKAILKNSLVLSFNII